MRTDARSAGALARAAETVAAYGPAAIILTLPLEFTAAVFHQQISRGVMAVVGLAFLYLVATRRRQLFIARNPSVVVLAVLIVVSLLSWAITRKPGSTNSALDMAAYPLFGLLTSNLVLSPADHRRAWFAFLVSAFGVAILGFGLYVFHGHIWTPNPLIAHRLNITFADPNITARFLTLGAGAAVYLYAERQSEPRLAFGAAAMCGIVLPMTWSRSGLALFVVTILLAVVVALDRRRAAAIGAVALVAFAVSLTVNPDTRYRGEAALESLAGIAQPAHGRASAPPSQGQGASALDDNRRYLIAAGLTMFKDHPLTGLGFGAYEQEILTTYRRFLPSGYTDSVSHTSFVTVLAEQGLIGGLLLVAFLLLLARESLRARARHGSLDASATAAGMLVVPIFLYSQFEARFFQEPYLWLMLGLFYSAQRLRTAHEQTEPGDKAPDMGQVPPRSIEAA